VFGWGGLENGYWFFVIGDWFKGKAKPSPKLFGSKSDSVQYSAKAISPRRRRERRGKAEFAEFANFTLS
jgi:hypothetical protein